MDSKFRVIVYPRKSKSLGSLHDDSVAVCTDVVIIGLYDDDTGDYDKYVTNVQHYPRRKRAHVKRRTCD